MKGDADWLQGLRRYLAVTAIANLIWEILHLPLYTIWTDGTPRDKAVAVLHCTGGDILLALGAWAIAVTVVGRPGWPAETFWRVAALVLLAGSIYTGFSEWLNTAVRRSWTYSEWMPVVPGLGEGLSPALQWIVIPALALWAAGPSRRRGAASSPIGRGRDRTRTLHRQR